MRIPSIILAFAGVLLLAACAETPKFEKAYADMTQRERDSVIAASKLPGAGVVKKAMNIADNESKRAAMYDSITEH